MGGKEEEEEEEKKKLFSKDLQYRRVGLQIDMIDIEDVACGIAAELCFFSR